MALKLTTYFRDSTLPVLPGSDTFQSTKLFHIYEETSCYDPILIVATEGDQVVGKLLAVIQENKKWFLPIRIKLCQVFGGGEYFIEGRENIENTFNEMLQRLTEVVFQRKANIIEVRNLRQSLFGYRPFRDNGFFAINWLRVRNVFHSDDTIEEQISPSKLRLIRKAINNGAVVREARNAEEIKAFVTMLRRNYSSKIRKHFPTPDFFQQLVKTGTFGQEGRIFIVLYKGKIIGGSTLMYSQDTAYLWFSGGLRKTYRRLYPGILAVWKALTDAKERGYKHLEFMDVGLPFRKHGYREFVLYFGGEQISTRRWLRFKWNVLNKILNKFYS